MTSPKTFTLGSERSESEQKSIKMHPSWGGYLCGDDSLPPVPGHEWRKYWPRVSGLKSVIEYTGALDEWDRARHIEGIFRDLSILSPLVGIEDFDSDEAKAIMKDVAKAAKEAGRGNDGAKAGTLAHTIIEAYNTGQDPDEKLADKHVLMLDAYGAKLKEKGLVPRPDLVERAVVNTEFSVMGTLDMVFEYRGSLVLGDLKTQKHKPGKFDKIGLSIQLACYATAAHILDPVAWKWVDMPKLNQTAAMVIWLPDNDPGHCATFKVPLDAGLRYARHSATAKEMQKEKSDIIEW